MAEPPSQTVLIVDDDPQVRLLYQAMLESEYAIKLADSGEVALATIDHTVDAVLLDRRMAGMSGGDVLRRLRDAGHDQPVGMVTALEPDFDVLEMGFDGYLVKPVAKAELRELVETLLLRSEYDAVMREYFGLVAKVTALERRKSAKELEASDAYSASSSRLELIKQQAQSALDTAIETGKFDDYFGEQEPEATDVTDLASH